jgi:hypothetical protein
MENKDNIRIIELSKYEAPVIQENSQRDWVDYGVDNNFFQYLIDRYTYSPTNNAVINNICKLIYGRGLSVLNASKKPNEYAQVITLFKSDDIKKWIQDRKMLGQFAIQVIYGDKRETIKSTHHIPVHLLRAEKCNNDGIIEAYWYSDNWDDVKKYPPQRIPAFGQSNEKLEILYCQPYTVGMKYYSYVDYQGALPYAVLEEEISNYLINEVQNGFSGTKIINFNNGIPTDEEMDDTERRVIGKLTGSKGKRVIVSFNHSEAQKTTVDDIPLNDAPDHYTYLSEECTRKLLLGHNVTSPLLFGISSTNGFSSNADELKNSFVLYYNMVIKPLQDELIDAFDKILNYNGTVCTLYFETLKPLEFMDASGKVVNEELSAYDDTAESLIKLGESPNEKWILIDEFEVDYDTDHMDAEMLLNPKKKDKTRLSKLIELVNTGFARPNAKSEQDDFVDGVKFITRYRYDGNIKSNSRLFCKKMIEANKIYRKEDILQMENQVVNEGWGPRGADTYDIWKYKGGGDCHHKWMKQVYASFDDSVGIDVNSPLARTIAVEKAEEFGYVVKNPRFVEMMPKDMPNRGFLPTNPRFKK